MKVHLSNEEQVKLATRAQAGDVQARNTLIASNIALIYKIAQRYTAACDRVGVSIGELVSEGSIAFTRAIARFDPSRGVHVISFATWDIRAAMWAYLQKQRHILSGLGGNKVPWRRLERRRAALRAQGMSEDAVEETLVREFNTTREKMAEAFMIARVPTSLDEIASRFDNGDGGVNLHQMLAASGPSAADVAEEAEFVRQVKQAISKAGLSPRQEEIVRRRFYGYETLEDVAQTFGVSRERVRQLQVDTIRKIRRRLQQDGVVAAR